MNRRTAEPTAAPPSVRDVRGFWRFLLAVVAPVPMLAQAIGTLVSPADAGAAFPETVAAAAADQQAFTATQWLNAVFVIGLIPATVAVAWAARRGAPRLATIGAVVALTGFLSGFGLLPDDHALALATTREALDLQAMTRLDGALWAMPVSGLASLLFIVGLTIGLALLGTALWRSRVAPAWTGIALIAGAVTHPFLPGAALAATGLAVGAVGFAGATVALLRLRNEEFDLPPVRA